MKILPLKNDDFGATSGLCKVRFRLNFALKMMTFGIKNDEFCIKKMVNSAFKKAATRSKTQSMP